MAKFQERKCVLCGTRDLGFEPTTKYPHPVACLICSSPMRSAKRDAEKAAAKEQSKQSESDTQGKR